MGKRSISRFLFWFILSVFILYPPFADATKEEEALYYKGRKALYSKEYKQAIKWFNKSANKGYAPAQHKLGDMLTNGRGFRRDYRKAIQWYTRAARQGYNPAQFELGQAYYKGLGTKRNWIKSYLWYHFAAKGGNKLAQKQLNRLHDLMDKLDLRKAVKTVQKLEKKNKLP